MFTRIRVMLVTAALTLGLGLAFAPVSEARIRAFPVGHFHQVGPEWRVKVVSRDLNANREIAAENQFNRRPRHGYQYVTVLVRGQKISKGRGYLQVGESFELLGRHTHRLYSPSSVVAPRGLFLTDAVVKGGKVTGNLPFEVRKSDIRAGRLLLRVESFAKYPSVVRYFRIH